MISAIFHDTLTSHLKTEWKILPLFYTDLRTSKTEDIHRVGDSRKVRYEKLPLWVSWVM